MVGFQVGERLEGEIPSLCGGGYYDEIGGIYE